MWNQIIMEAMSEFEYKNPGVLEDLQSVTPDNAWDHPKFGVAASVVVEPDNILQRNCDDDLELFHAKCENEGMGFIKGVVQNDLWNHIIETVDKTGY
jgi:hypothetical protein